jgi:hypothetical protein
MKKKMMMMIREMSMIIRMTASFHVESGYSNVQMHSVHGYHPDILHNVQCGRGENYSLIN